MGIFWAIVAAVAVIRQIVRKKRSNQNDILILIIAIIFVGLQNFGILYHGGFQVRNELESDAKVVQGEIIQIEELPIYVFPKIGGKRGYNITVNDVKCTIVGRGDFELGDYVLVEYLPRSSYVLSITEIAEGMIN